MCSLRLERDNETVGSRDRQQLKTKTCSRKKRFPIVNKMLRKFREQPVDFALLQIEGSKFLHKCMFAIAIGVGAKAGFAHMIYQSFVRQSVK